MPRLVHLNGPPGIGKSTLARRYVDDRPLAFCLDIDGFRGLIGRWDSHEQESGRLARRMALAMAREHLSGGHDVVVPQLVARPEFVDELATVARDAGALFHEIVLLDDAAAARARFERRADDPLWLEHHRAAARMIASAGGFDVLYAAMLAAIPSLRGAVVVPTVAGDTDDAYRAVLAAIETGG